MSGKDTEVNPVRDFWIDHLWSDILVALVLIGAHGFLVILWSGADVFGNALPTDRRAVYTAAAIVVSLLGSFSGVAIGQLGAAKGARTAALKRQGGELLARNWQSVFRTAMLAALVAILALLIDPSTARPGVVYVVVRWVFEFVMVVAVLKFLRLSALFSEVMSLASLEAGDSDQEPAAPPTPHPGWNKRAS